MTNTADIGATANDWWWQALTSERSLRLIVILIVALIVVLWLVRVMLILNRARRHAATPRELNQFTRDLIRSTQASTTIEFALVVPILLFFVLILTQTTLTMGGNLFVHYAAFAAARSAIVYIPSDGPDEPANTLNGADSSGSDGSEKMSHIQSAAAVALIPVAGRLSDGAVGAEDFVAGLYDHYAAYNQTVPHWVDTLAAERFRYAAVHTQAQVLRTNFINPDSVQYTPIPSLPYTFGPKEPVTVRITHRLHLGVPYIGAIFADGSQQTATGTTRYTLVDAQYTLNNEGIVDQLPPQTTLPRRP